jgi:glycosyltransferase involved in cell wall biosynthesis
MNEQSLSILIPVFNEEGSLKELFEQILISVSEIENWEVIFIDDGSNDNSISILKEISDSNSHVKVIQFYKNFGKSDALSEGFKTAKGDIVITMDADLQDDPSEIPNLMKKVSEGWDVVSGWKKKRHDPISKRWPSKIFNKVTRLLTGVHIHDFNCGLKAYRLKVVKAIELYGGLHRYIPAIASQKGFSVTEIEVNHRPREHGETKYGGARYFHGFFDLLTVIFLGKYFSRPLHFFGFIGLIFSIIGMGINLYLTAGWFNGNPIGNRPIFFLGILLLIVGIQFFSIGLLGELMIRYSHKNEKRVEKVFSNSSK